MLTLPKIALFLTMIFTFASSGPIAAQNDDSCSALVQNALSVTQEACQSSTGVNQACYGNITLSAEPQPGVSNLTFEQQGDIVDVDEIRTLRLSSMNADVNEWGVAYLQLQANLVAEDDVAVTLLLFGDVGLENAVDPLPERVTINVTSSGSVNVRGGPSTNNAVVGALQAGEVVTVDGRNDDGSWLRFQFEDGQTGWVFAQLMTSEDDIMSLESVGADSEIIEPQFGPMQAFIVETGVDDAPCEAAPDSGLLIQTPEGVGEVNLLINEVDIRIRSTIYVQSQPNDEMIVNVVEGSSRISAEGESVSAPAGTRVRVAMDAANLAAGPPSDPEPYNDPQMARLPVDVLPRTVEIAPALSEAEINEVASELIPLDGVWLENVDFEGAWENTFNIVPEGLRYVDLRTGATAIFPIIEPGKYTQDPEGRSDVPSYFQVISPTEIHWIYESGDWPNDIFRRYLYLRAWEGDFDAESEENSAP